MSQQALVIGAGMGGLSSALLMAHAGLEVTVLEMGQYPGGKAGITTLEGVTCDTGPSLMTMVDVLDDLFAKVGMEREEHITLRKLDPAFRYLYPDGTVIDIHHDLEATRESVREALGQNAVTQLDGFLRYASKIWEASAPPFVYSDAPSPGRMVRMDLSTLASMRHIDAMSLMWKAISKRVDNQHLRWMLARYATYNGSDVRQCPATLNCIAHVELVQGGWGVQGGMQQIGKALMKAAQSFGARFLFGQQVQKIHTQHNKVHEVTTVQGDTFPTKRVVCNVDARHLFGDLIPGRHQDKDYEPSMSGWNAIIRASKTQARSQASHNVIFPKDYMQEFADIFDHRKVPDEPTIYTCNQSLAHQIQGWQDADPLFVMINAPARQPGVADIDTEHLRNQVIGKLTKAGLMADTDPVLWQRSPRELAQRFPGSQGSIYGSSSNSRFAAFRRPANRDPRTQGLYLASGSAHPGGGVPLCLLSGCAAARAVLQDRSAP